MNKLLIFCEIFVTEHQLICSNYADNANADFSFSDNFDKRIFTLYLPRNKFLLCDLSFCSIFDIPQTCKNFYHRLITPFVFCNYIIHQFKRLVKPFSKIFFVILHKFSFIKNLQSFQDLFINAEPQSLQKIFFLFTIYSHKVDRAHQKRSTQVNEFFVKKL